MSSYISDRDSSVVTDAARTWVTRCLIEDGSIFSSEHLWTRQNFDELEVHYVQNLEEGTGTLYEKLDAQLEHASGPAKRLMAEIIWAVLLFPSNIGVERKREDIRRVWGWSGSELPSDSPMLADGVLNGIGSGGPGINNHRWRELVYVVSFGIQVKKLPMEDRSHTFKDYDAFLEWVGTVPTQGKRQFPIMLRYLLFPDRVERMSSDIDRRRVLHAFEDVPMKELKELSSRDLDDRLFALRKKLEARYKTRKLDFYEPPLKTFWNEDNSPGGSARLSGDDDQEEEVGQVSDGAREYASTAPAFARNVILYGPPGTGKTHELRERMREYTDQPADIERSEWEQAVVSRFGWRAVIAAALADIGTPVKVTGLVTHPLISARAADRRHSNLNQIIWGYLQSHTDPTVETVNVKARREPYLFTKNSESEWSLMTEEWRDLDGDAADLLDEWRLGPETQVSPIQRYRLVTFHPSYSYEDFVIGLRPVHDDDGAARFELVPGTFMQICAVARANPSRRYALFIDEINRADVARVFGELITLIEPDKRARYDNQGNLLEGLEVQLPGTGTETPRFGVPENLDIYGTMNTADRSIALLDIALRRRFEFEELPPRYDRLDREIDGVHLGRLLRAMNDRLEFLIDRDHRIGHAYLMQVTSLSDLRLVFLRQVIPLLQEYFFDDWSRIAMVLATGPDRSAFLQVTLLDGAHLFGSAPDGADRTRDRIEISDPGGWSPSDFSAIYESIASPAGAVGVSTESSVQ